MEQALDADVTFRTNGVLGDQELNDLFAAAWPDHQHRDFAGVLDRSTCWVAARRGGELVGFVHVAWDGGEHGFVLDTTVHPSLQGRGIGRRLVDMAVEHARAKGMAWVHVDFEPALAPFYEACGFQPTSGGIILLQGHPSLGDEP